MQEKYFSSPSEIRCIKSCLKIVWLFECRRSILVSLLRSPIWALYQCSGLGVWQYLTGSGLHSCVHTCLVDEGGGGGRRINNGVLSTKR